MNMNIVMKHLLEDDMNYSEIARKLNVSRQAVHQAVTRYKNKTFVKPTTCVYPGLRNWMNANRVKVSAFIRLCDSSGKSDRTIRYYLNGEKDMRKSTIDTILKVTGLTYEQAFGDNVE